MQNTIIEQTNTRLRGWESVCWGVLGTPFLDFLYLEIYQDFTIVKFRLPRRVGETDRFTHQNSKIPIKKSILCQTCVCSNRICLCFKTMGFSQLLFFEISEISKNPQCWTLFLPKKVWEEPIDLDPRTIQNYSSTINSSSKVCLR